MKSILIGNDNAINQRLLEEMNKLMKATLIDHKAFLEFKSEVNIKNPDALFYNLMDIGGQEDEIITISNELFPKVIRIAIHTFLNQALIDHTIRTGYNVYLPIFQISDKLPELISQLEKSTNHIQ